MQGDGLVEVNFGSFLKSKRQEKNLTQKELANLLFVTESAVSKWERGVSYPDITLISDICKVLDISEKELIQSSDDSEYRKIKSNSDKFNKIKKGLFLSINVCYIIAILVCFIVNLAVNHTLSWFFIVLTSILVKSIQKLGATCGFGLECVVRCNLQLLGLI